MNLYALIVAGGQGSRMNSSIPKQFLELNGKPILLHTLEAFHQYESRIQIVLVLPKDQMDHWRKMIEVYDIKMPHELVEGGRGRFESVKNGLSKIEEEGLVAIHDGVRPLLTQKIITEGYNVAAQKGNAVVAVKLKDSIRRVSDEGSHSVDRSNYRVIQTPQTFNVALIKKAYERTGSNKFTDDASVLESEGVGIHLIDGSYSNIKITTQEDLIIASSLLSEMKKA